MVRNANGSELEYVPVDGSMFVWIIKMLREVAYYRSLGQDKEMEHTYPYYQATDLVRELGFDSVDDFIEANN